MTSNPVNAIVGTDNCTKIDSVWPRPVLLRRGRDHVQQHCPANVPEAVRTSSDCWPHELQEMIVRVSHWL